MYSISYVQGHYNPKFVGYYLFYELHLRPSGLQICRHQRVIWAYGIHTVDLKDFRDFKQGMGLAGDFAASGIQSKFPQTCMLQTIQRISHLWISRWASGPFWYVIQDLGYIFLLGHVHRRLPDNRFGRSLTRLDIPRVNTELYVYI